MKDLLRLSDEVRQALTRREAVVALESSVIAQGLPRPRNLEAARACEAAVRRAGAVPATIALAGGEARVGADDALLRELAERDGVAKASVADIAPILAAGALGATTVAASVDIAARAGIGVFATGGIGGVHRGAERTADESADLSAIARTPVCVVCAGAKIVLDIARTLERLESLGVPVVSVGSDDFPAFTVRSSGIRAAHRADDAASVARIAAVQLARGAGLVVALPVAPEHALDRAAAEDAVARALAEAERAGVRAGAVTPFLLRSMAARERAAVDANVALLVANARFAGEVAVALRALENDRIARPMA